MEEFQNQRNHINESIKYLKDCTSKLIHVMKGKRNPVLSKEDEDRLHSELQTIEGLFREKTKEIKRELDEVKKKNDLIKSKNYNSSSNIEYESRNSNWQSMTTNFFKACNEFKDAQCMNKEIEQQNIMSQYKIVYPNANEDELKKIIENRADENIDAFGMVSQGSSRAKDSYERAKERSKRLDELIKSIAEIGILINELHEMVQKSGRTIDRIEIKISDSVETTAKSKRELQSALKYQLSATKIKRIFYGILFILLIVAVIYFGIKIYNSLFKDH